MDLLIFGATGGTGRALTRLALDAGHTVTAVCRTPADLGVGHDSLRAVEGDVFEPESFRERVSGKDAVLSCLGVRPSLRTIRKPPPVYSEGTRTILSEMDRAGVERFIGLTSWSVDDDNPEPFFWKVGRKVIAKIYDDMREMERRVRVSEAAWTLVRPAMLTDGGLTLAYREFSDVTPQNGWRVSRADVAHFMLREAEAPRYVRGTVEIAY